MRDAIENGTTSVGERLVNTSSTRDSLGEFDADDLAGLGHK